MRDQLVVLGLQVPSECYPILSPEYESAPLALHFLVLVHDQAQLALGRLPAAHGHLWAQQVEYKLLRATADSLRVHPPSARGKQIETFCDPGSSVLRYGYDAPALLFPQRSIPDYELVFEQGQPNALTTMILRTDSWGRRINSWTYLKNKGS